MSKRHDYIQYYKDNKEALKRNQQKWSTKNLPSILFYAARARAKFKGLEFTISKEDITIPEYCPILNIKLDNSTGNGHRQNGPSIDRIDSSKGYTKENIQIISILANRMKQEATVEQLKQFGEWTRIL